MAHLKSCGREESGSTPSKSRQAHPEWTQLDRTVEKVAPETSELRGGHHWSGGRSGRGSTPAASRWAHFSWHHVVRTVGEARKKRLDFGGVTARRVDAMGGVEHRRQVGGLAVLGRCSAPCRCTPRHAFESPVLDAFSHACALGIRYVHNEEVLQ